MLGGRTLRRQFKLPLRLPNEKVFQNVAFDGYAYKAYADFVFNGCRNCAMLARGTLGLNRRGPDKIHMKCDRDIC